MKKALRIFLSSALSAVLFATSPLAVSAQVESAAAENVIEIEMDGSMLESLLSQDAAAVESFLLDLINAEISRASFELELEQAHATTVDLDEFFDGNITAVKVNLTKGSVVSNLQKETVVEDGLSISTILPVVTLSNQPSEVRVNRLIENIYEAELNKAKISGAKEFNFFCLPTLQGNTLTLNLYYELAKGRNTMTFHYPLNVDINSFRTSLTSANNAKFENITEQVASSPILGNKEFVRLFTAMPEADIVILSEIVSFESEVSEVSGFVPFIAVANSEAFTNQLNEVINNIYENELNAALEANVESFEFSYSAEVFDGSIRLELAYRIQEEDSSFVLYSYELDIDTANLEIPDTEEVQFVKVVEGGEYLESSTTEQDSEGEQDLAENQEQE